MTLQMQAVVRNGRRRVALGCNLVWETAEMTDEERAAQEAAMQDLEALDAKFLATEKAHQEARDALHQAIVSNLMSRTLTPTQVSASTHYDRVHVGRIARAGGVPPLRKRTVRPLQDES